VPASPGRLHVAVLYGAEPYQAYHVSDIAAGLAHEPDVDLTMLTVDAAIGPVLQRLEAGQFAHPPRHERLHVPGWVKLLRRARLFGILKNQVLSHPANLERLAQFDAIVTPTTHVADLRARVPASTRFIYCFHGAGGRQVSYSPKMRSFDLILTPGLAASDRLVSEGFAEPDAAVSVGLAKIETCRRLVRQRPRLFDNDAPVVLFNPHSKRSLRSWEKFAQPLIDAAASGAFNLIVAPHVKLFARKPGWLWRKWERKAVPGRVHVDLGSEASLDMRYTLAADIYVGDVSSQVYEFLVEPKPCVFLNAHGAEWQGNPDYPMWRLGEVASTPAEAIRLISRAFDDHPRFIETQQAERSARLGDDPGGAADRAADAILAFLRDR
jgi:hypothetical protein